MRIILHDFLNGKMNFRKFILWVFAAMLLGCVLVSAFAVTRAIYAVAAYTEANPNVWVERR